MSELSAVMAKLSGIRMAIVAVLNDQATIFAGERRVRRRVYAPADVEHHFAQAASSLELLQKLLPDLYGDFQAIKTIPEAEMSAARPGVPAPTYFSLEQVERLIRDIDQIFEIRANSQLEQPRQEAARRVFISHGRSNDWRVVQPFIERDVGLPTTELAQEASLGRTIIEKLMDTAARCDSAVIVMTGDDVANEDEARVRENVMHEIGFFQGRYGRNAVVLLHEEGVNIPTNLAGVAYVAFPKGSIEAGFHVLQRELRAIYKI